MNTPLSTLLPHPEGEQPSVEESAATAETFAGRVHVEWDSDGLVTPLGQLPFFVEYLKQAGLFAGWVADRPRRQHCADLQLVELVRPSGRSRSSTRSGRQAPLIDACD